MSRIKLSGDVFFAVLVIVTCFIAAQAYLSICPILYENTANKHWQNRRYQVRKNSPDNRRLVDSAQVFLQSGDLVVRRGDDMTSYMLSRLNNTDQSYSHCGIVIVEDGIPYIYHSIGGEDNPDETMRRDAASQWFSPANNHAFAIYRYVIADSLKEKMVKTVQEFYREKRKFDMDFDIDTDDRLYCSEMVWKAVSAADNSLIPLQTGYGRMFAGIDNLYLNAYTRCICHVRFK